MFSQQSVNDTVDKALRSQMKLFGKGDYALKETPAERDLKPILNSKSCLDQQFKPKNTGGDYAIMKPQLYNPEIPSAVASYGLTQAIAMYAPQGRDHVGPSGKTTFLRN